MSDNDKLLNRLSESERLFHGSPIGNKIVDAICLIRSQQQRIVELEAEVERLKSDASYQCAAEWRDKCKAAQAEAERLNAERETYRREATSLEEEIYALTSGPVATAMGPLHDGLQEEAKELKSQPALGPLDVEAVAKAYDAALSRRSPYLLGMSVIQREAFEEALSSPAARRRPGPTEEKLLAACIDWLREIAEMTNWKSAEIVADALFARRGPAMAMWKPHFSSLAGDGTGYEVAAEWRDKCKAAKAEVERLKASQPRDTLGEVLAALDAYAHAEYGRSVVLEMRPGGSWIVVDPNSRAVHLFGADARAAAAALIRAAIPKPAPTKREEALAALGAWDSSKNPPLTVKQIAVIREALEEKKS